MASFDLGPASDISLEISEFRNALRNSSSTDAALLGHQLHRSVMAPLEPALSGVTDLFLCPDGDLNLTPFAALLDEGGKYLFERYAVHYLTAGRDLLQQPTPVSNRPVAIFANPAYGSRTQTARAERPA